MHAVWFVRLERPMLHCNNFAAIGSVEQLTTSLARPFIAQSTRLAADELHIPWQEASNWREELFQKWPDET